MKNKEIIEEFKEKLEKIEEDYTCIEYNAVCRAGFVQKLNAIENIVRNALSRQKEEFKRVVKGKRRKGSILEEVRKGVSHPTTYNQALTDILKAIDEI